MHRSLLSFIAEGIEGSDIAEGKIPHDKDGLKGIIIVSEHIIAAIGLSLPKRDCLAVITEGNLTGATVDVTYSDIGIGKKPAKLTLTDVVSFPAVGNESPVFGLMGITGAQPTASETEVERGDYKLTIAHTDII